MFAVMAATGVGYLSANMMPMWLGSVMDGLAIGPEQAGRLGSAELLAGAAASLFVAPLVGRIPRRRLALTACGLVGVGYLLSAFTGTYLPLVLLRAATGLCCGVLLAVGNAAAAGAREPDRVFAAMGFFGGLAASAIIVILGHVAVGGYGAIFLVLAGAVAVSLPLLGWLPEGAGATGPTLNEKRARPLLAPIATLAALFLLSISGQGLWAFSERIGVGIGLETERIGWWISLANLAGLPAAGLAAWLGTRVGRTRPIALALTLSGLSQWSLVNANSETVYVAAQVTWALAFFFWLPFVMGTAAELDRTGRWAVVGGAVTMLGVALGPWGAGQLLERLPEFGLSVLVVGCAAAGMLLLIPVTLALDRHARSAT
jgi:predicted MFS family arabinose efflux permease